MALTLKSEYKISIDGTKIFVTDKTGEYEVTTNPGGWGTSNENLSESCLVCLVIRKASTGDQLFEPISPLQAYIYDDTLLNSDVKTFEIKYTIDGVMDVVLIRLPVSLDDINIVDAGALSEADVYYYDGLLYKYTSGVGVEIEDYTTLLDEVGLVKDVCSDVATPLSAIKAQLLYKEYILEREKSCDDAEPLFQELLKLNEDIRGVYYTFWSNLKVAAQNQIEDLLDRYEITGN